MLRQELRGLALLGRAFECCQYRCQSSKTVRKSIIMKNRVMEDNLFFGKLLESKKNKAKRLKLDSQGKLIEAEPSAVDSEFMWMKEYSSKMRIIRCNRGNEELNGIQEPVSNEKFEMTDCNDETSETKIECNDIEIETPVIPNSTVDTSTEVQETAKIIPDDVIENLLTTPLYNIYKKFKVPTDKKSSIISLSPMNDKQTLRYPSVTKILTATMSDTARIALEKWKANLIEQLGLENFEIYMKDLIDSGKMLHSTIASYLMNELYEVPDSIKSSYSSLAEVLENIDNVQAIESHVVHPRLRYRGIIDCIASYRGELCVIDWKKSEKAKSTIHATYDAPVQLASYIGALNADKNYPFQVQKGLIVVAYTNGDPAQVHEVSEESLHMYWKYWLERLQDYHLAGSQDATQSSRAPRDNR